ncbi:Alpha-N-acetylglucosaminidase [Streptomyces venezuelae]|uniref:alpha-N-acetylglucosaminidase n=1 Tax=Streptomyces gardneri TaxID=66892 RepID=UPI0006BCF3B6|nr:alpha-N-acetylglucosaminidase [Streptomyces gardneri]ALO06931.1 Alpha-N-acetylglucosaminidase [Streptomyces venezuelae]QPK44306.1 alpha-N-acetylglucosaminidase [Streptomyces gardneri]WRK35596.1 alpha-N-acetylglucosaminidase [Streptomyces venezuelae]CUM42771.1 Alpha-N-acetylglucosaminidase [Streptomyces venezuelae]
MASRLILRCRPALVLVALALLTAVSPAATTAAPVPAPVPVPGPPPSSAFDPAPARAGLERLLPSVAGQFELVAVEEPASGDYFSVSGTAGAIQVRGTSPATLLAGVGWYLERVAGVDVGWPGDSLGRLPSTLPEVTGTITHTAAVPHRYALNDTDEGYSGAYRDFASYRHDIDLMALHGVNEVFVPTGAEYAYYLALQRFGYSAAELRDWIPAPAHQGWWLLQNMSGFAGPVSEQLIEARASLGSRIAEHLRSLGMTPVLPGFFGTVPPEFAARNPGAVTVPQGKWVGFARPDWLDPTGPVFAELAATYYSFQQQRFGDSDMFKMDLLHEGGTPGPVDVAGAAGAVQAALEAAHPGATWVMLGWQTNPSEAFLSGVDRRRVLVVDGLSDRYDGLDRETQWGGTPYAFGSIGNFGGHTSLGSNTGVWGDRFHTWLTAPGSSLRGIAYLPEGTGGNPAAFDLFTELAWQPGPVDHRSWFAAYAARRYGGADPHAAAAWEQLRLGPYSMPSGTWSEPQDGLLAARPSLTATRAARWSPSAMRYDAATVERALAELLRVAPELRATDAYRYDVVDVARQALTNRGRVLLPRIRTAYEAKDRARFRELVAEWNAQVELLGRLVASDRRFLLGPWLADARAWGADPAERDRLEYDARSILTTWGDRVPSESGGLHDYANREWAGLVQDVYAPRWAAYFASLDTALANRTDPQPIDWFARDDAWARGHKQYTTTPTGDPVALAAEVLTALSK